jgi:type I restriction enzyme S subunit
VNVMSYPVRLGDYVRIRTGKLDANASSPDGAYPFFTCSQEPLRISSFSYDCECVLVAGNGDLNVKYYAGKFDAYQRTYIVEALDNTKLNVRYLYCFLARYVERLRAMSIGGVIKYIKLDYLTEAKIPLPRVEEQWRIAEVLDRAEALRAKRRAALAQLDALTQSIFLDLFGDPLANPMGWPRLSLGSLLTNIESGWSPTCLDRPVKGDEWGVLKLGAVTWCEYDSSENKALPPEITPDPRLEVKTGDLLFTRKNTYDLVAACALVRSTPPKLLMSDLIFRFRLRPDAEMVAVTPPAAMAQGHMFSAGFSKDQYARLMLWSSFRTAIFTLIGVLALVVMRRRLMSTESRSA